MLVFAFSILNPFAFFAPSLFKIKDNAFTKVAKKTKKQILGNILKMFGLCFYHIESL